MRAAVLSLILALLLSPAALAASKTFSDNQTYDLNGEVFVVHLFNADAVLLEHNQTKSVFKKDECMVVSSTRTCLTSASVTSASFTEEDISAELKVTHTHSVSSAEIGTEVTGTITFENTGELTATDLVASITFPDGLVNANDGTQVWTDYGYVDNKRTMTYRFEPERNGTYAITGNATYWDGNRTETVELKSLKFTATLPFSYKIGYANNTTVEPTVLNVNVTRLIEENYTLTVTAAFPPEAKIYAVSRSISSAGNTFTYRNSVNTSDMVSANITYGFTAAPSGPLLVSIEYKNGSKRQSITQELPFTTFLANEPSLAVSVDPLSADQAGQLRVIVTGNLTGELRVTSALVNATLAGGPDTYTFTIPPSKAGNYTAGITFTTTDSYGSERVAKGSVVLAVAAARTETSGAESVPTKGTANATGGATEGSVSEGPGSQDVASAALQTSQWLFIIAGVAAVSLVIVLLVFIRKLRDPLARLEKLAGRTAALRLALAQKRAAGSADPEELAGLEALEKELAELGKGL